MLCVNMSEMQIVFAPFLFLFFLFGISMCGFVHIVSLMVCLCYVGHIGLEDSIETKTSLFRKVYSWNS